LDRRASDERDAFFGHTTVRHLMCRGCRLREEFSRAFGGKVETNPEQMPRI